METKDWTFPTLSYVWDARDRVIVAGGERLDALTVGDRERSLAELRERVTTLAGQLDDSWLVLTAFWMVEDIYKSFFREFRWTPGVHDYVAATAQPVVRELKRRGFVLHYVIDATQGDTDLAQTLAHLPGVFRAAGFGAIGPQVVAAHMLQEAEGQPPADISAIQRYREEGHAVADDVISRWHRERQSSVYLNLDLDDDLPALSLDVALSQQGRPGTAVVFRDRPPAEGAEAHFMPPPGLVPPAAEPAGYS